MYYTIISRDEFIKLYRFGSIGISSNYLLDDDENIETSLIELFKILPLEYEESYLILKINDKINGSFETIKIIYNLNIAKVKSVYVLSSEAQHFYKTKVNQKVNFQITSFKTILEKVMNFKEKQDIDEGINILSKLDFINKEEIETKLGDDFRDNFLKFEEYLSVPFQNFYLDLLSYKRENIFPKNDIGFIYDFVIIAKLQKRETDFIERYPIGEIPIEKFPFYNSLNQNQEETLFEKIEFILTTDNEAIKKFINNIDNTHLISGVIFLKIKYLLKEDNRDKNTWQEILNIVDSFSKKYKDKLSIALYLIGLFYGYKNLYDYYYNFLKLDIFKDNNTIKSEAVEEKEEVDLRDEKLKTLEEENEKLRLELEEMKGKSNKGTIQKVKEEPSDVSSEDNTKIENKLVDKHEINTFTDEEILVFPRSHLEKIAKKRRVEKPTSKKIYPKGDEGQIKLYKAILKMSTSLI